MGILVAIAVPRLTGSRHNAARKAVEANLRTIDSAVTIAEAEEKLDATFKAAATTSAGGSRLDILATDLGYLASIPKTEGATYGIIGSGTPGSPYRAAVTITDISNFGVAKTFSDTTIEKIDWNIAAD